jgi:hypothetical protein
MQEPSTKCPRRLLGAALVAVVALLAFGEVSAHELPNERSLLIQVSADRLEIMIVYLEPPGAAVDLLLSRYDLDGDRELQGGEAQLAGPEWMERVLRGLQFEVADEQPVAKPPEIKFRREPGGALSAAVYARWDLPPMGTDARRTVHIRLLGDHHHVPTELRVRPGEGTKLIRLDLPDRLRGSPRRPTLQPGEEVTLHLTPAPPSPDMPAKK